MINWADALRVAKLVEITEEVPIEGSESILRQHVEARGGEFLEPIYGYELSNLFTSKLGRKLLYGYIARFPGPELIIALRCTETFVEAIKDVMFFSVPNPVKNGRGFVATGWRTIYQSLQGRELPLIEAIRSHLRRDKLQSMTIAGHSLGGALAPMVALDVALNLKTKKPVVYTFGAPRTGGEMFARQYSSVIKESYRVVVKYDIVQTVPILPAYYHIDERIELVPPPKTIKFDLLCMHHLSTYVFLLQEKVGKGPDKLGSGCEWCTWWGRIKNWLRFRR